MSAQEKQAKITITLPAAQKSAWIKAAHPGKLVEFIKEAVQSKIGGEK